MHSRRTLRGLAAAMLTTALVAGGALLVAPAGYAEVLPDSETSASVPAEPQEPAQEERPPAAPADGGSGDASAAEDPPSAGEPAPTTQQPAIDDASDPHEGAEEGGTANETEPAAVDPAAQRLIAAAPQGSSEVSLQLEIAVAPKKSLTVAIQASGFDDEVHEIEAALIEKGAEAGLNADEHIARADPSPAVSSGETAFELTAPVGDLDRTQQYEVLLWTPGADPAEADSVYARADLPVTNAHWDQLFGAAPVDPAWNAKAVVGSFEWGVRESFRKYVVGPIAGGSITVTKPAAGKDVFTFPQVKNTWNPETQRGTISYAGSVNFRGHEGVLDLDLANPIVNVKTASSAELQVPYDGKILTIATIDLKASGATKHTRSDGSIRFANTVVKLTEAGAETYFEGYVQQDYELDPLSFTVGADSKTAKPVDPPTKKPTENKPKPKPTQPKPLPPVTTGSGSQAAGSLSWGISSAFASYVTGPIAKGEVSTSGVGRSGGGYLFPQAAGGNWSTAAQTGSVQYSGVVTFTGHKGLLSETFSNPVITVSSASSGTISSGGRSFGLDLASASKSVGRNGEVTWSGVPVLGGISGGASGGNQYTLAVDPLSFTVGTASTVSYGSTAVSNASLKRTAADAPPATTGIRVITPAKDIVPGGEIEFEAPGFESKEREILVVLYSDPVVLDEAAGADENGTVRWIGTIPEDTEPGEHTITLQGSTNAGAVITVLDGKRAKKAAVEQQIEIPDSAQQSAPVAAGVVPAGSAVPQWSWWIAAIGLVAVAGAMGGLVARQRRALAHTDAQSPDQ